MDYALLWVGFLLSTLLVVALAATAAARTGRGWLGMLLMVCTFTPPAVFLGMAVAVGSILRVNNVEPDWFFYSLAELLAFMGGSVVIVRFALRDGGAGSAARGAAWPIGKLAAAAGLALAAFLGTLFIIDAGVKREMREAAADAEALALEASPTRVERDNNAAHVYRQAFDAYVYPADISRAAADKCGRWFSHPETLDRADPELTIYLARNAPAIALLRRAAAMPGCNFERDYGHPRADLLGLDPLMMREGARMLMLECCVRSDRGDAAGALEDFAVIRAMARHQGGDPLVFSHLDSCAMVGFGHSALERLLASTEPTAAGLAAPGAPEPPFSPSANFAHSLRMEEAFGQATMVMLSGAGPREDFSVDILGDPPFARTMASAVRYGGPVWRIYFLRRDMQNHRRILRRMQGASLLPPHEMLAGVRAVEQDWPLRQRGLMTRMLIPLLAKAGETTCRAEARLRMQEAALALSAHRAKHGRYPETLGELVPAFLAAVPLDPYDGQPLRMVRADGGIVLYCVGPDGRDDGSRELEQRSSRGEKNPGDLTFCLGGAYWVRRARTAERGEAAVKHD